MYLMAAALYIYGSYRMRSAQSATLNSKKWHLFPPFNTSPGTLAPVPIKMTNSSSCWDCRDNVILPVQERQLKNLSRPPLTPLYTHTLLCSSA